MPLSTEVFVMIIFISGIPFFYTIFHDSGLKGAVLFMLAYICLTVSNCLTVLEDFWLNSLFNFGEHLFISIAAVLMFAAIFRMILDKGRKTGKTVERLKG